MFNLSFSNFKHTVQITYFRSHSILSYKHLWNVSNSGKKIQWESRASVISGVICSNDSHILKGELLRTAFIQSALSGKDFQASYNISSLVTLLAHVTIRCLILPLLHYHSHRCLFAIIVVT